MGLATEACTDSGHDTKVCSANIETIASRIAGHHVDCAHHFNNTGTLRLIVHPAVNKRCCGK